MRLYKFQEEAYQYFYEHDGQVYFAFDTGLGKTITALNIAKDFKKVLILCPASVKFVWQKEMEKFNLYPRYHEIYSYDYFREHGEQILRKNFFDLIIFDEAHKLKSVKAKITRLCMKIFPKSKKIMLSATPFEKLEDFYSQLRILTHTHYFHRFSFSDYKIIFFKVDLFKKIVGFKDKATKEFFYEKFVHPYVWFLKKENVIELPDLMEDVLTIKTTTYFDGSKPLSTINALSFFISLYHKESFSKEKIEFIKEFLENNPHTVVFSYFKEPLKILKGLIKDCYYIDGENKADLEKACGNGGKPLLATYTLKEGVNLTNYSNIVFLSLPMAYRDYYQAISRLYRIGQGKKVYVVKLLASKIDKFVDRILQQKRNLLEELKTKTLEEIQKEIEEL
jgi:superfamily II DNA or RNA helicase